MRERNRIKGRGTQGPGARPGEGPAGGRASPARPAPCSPVPPGGLVDGTGLGKLPASTWLCLSALGSSWDHFYSSSSKFVFELKAPFPEEF